MSVNPRFGGRVLALAFAIPGLASLAVGCEGVPDPLPSRVGQPARPGRAARPGQAAQGVVEAVDPFIGTGGHGHVYPGATVPFGMVQLSPDNGRGGWDWVSGYHWTDSVIVGFSHTHLSGTGIGDLLDILVAPVAGEPDLRSGAESYRDEPWASRFSHDRESASPGY